MNVRINSLLCLLLAGCSLFKPQPAAKGKSFGVLDKEHAILLEDIAKLPSKTIMKNYLGKTVTFKYLRPRGGYCFNRLPHEKNICDGFFDHSEDKYLATLSVWFHADSETIMSTYPEHVANPEILSHFQPLQFPFNICDPDRWNNCDTPNLIKDGKVCAFSNDSLYIAGKIFGIDYKGAEQGGYSIYIVPTGLAN
ncbi:MAG: hypothetical protein IPK50_05780 [Fibrobacterota bacterium]|nr:hypothetical protein [Fibrobacterota bacterium]QQS06405.1 MAG: hypothetical protein IPK50_05780 [Fibrobacterota bacterium]